MNTHTETEATFNVKNTAGQTLIPANLKSLELAERGARRAHNATGELHTVEMTIGNNTSTVYIAG